MKIYVISGKAGAGKDTLAVFLKESLEAAGKRVLITHYADLLKHMLRSFFGWNGEKDEFGRSLLQRVGTDVIRAQDPDFWVDFLIRVFRFFPDEWDFVLIPDARFPNEIDRLKEAGFEVEHLRVWRSAQNTAPMTEAQLAHQSETALDDVKPDWAICNIGNLSSFRVTAENLAGELLGYHQYTFEEMLEGPDPARAFLS